VEYGVLDIPGFDVFLGMGFLQQCAPYQLQDDEQGQRSVRLTSPSSRRVPVAVLEAESAHGAIRSNLGRPGPR
jgi:hypothetical protein